MAKISPITQNLGQFTNQMKTYVCPMCGASKWKEPVVVAQPLIRGSEATLDLAAPFVYISAVYACEGCKFEVRFRAGQVDDQGMIG